MSARSTSATVIAGVLALLLFAGGMGAATTATAAPPAATAAAATAVPAAAPVVVKPCQMLRLLPAYGYRYQGAAVTVPTGDVRYREVVADGVRGAALQGACRAMVRDQVRRNGAPAPMLAVYRELRLG